MEDMDRLLAEWKNRTGKDIFIQSEDGVILASTCSLREVFFREAVGGNLPPGELKERAGKLELDFSGGRVLFLLDCAGVSVSLLTEVATAIFGKDLEPESCVGDRSGKLLFLAESSSMEESFQLADLLRGSLEVETLTKVRVGLSRRFLRPEGLAAAREEAGLALKSLGAFPGSGKVAAYERLGLKLAAMRLPEAEKKAFLAGFPGQPEQLFSDPELVHTAEVFLETALNSAETARRLVVHRNTLNYRLDKIERISGLDLKKFDDAAAFYYALLIWKSHYLAKGEELL